MAVPLVPQERVSATDYGPIPVIVSTVNVNGVRAAVRERSAENLGFLPWLTTTTADIVCLQETRADDEQLRAALAPALAGGWLLASAGPHLKGRNGVAVLSRHPITRAKIGPASADSPGAGDEFAAHGRYLEVDIGDLTVASLYFPTGEAETLRQLEKERFMAAVSARMAELLRTGRDAVICGDWNIGHTELDIKAWKANRGKAGFLPEEREWLTKLMDTGWGRRRSRPAPRDARPLQLVVVARQGVRQRRRVADRLSAGEQAARRPRRLSARGARRGLRAALVRSRARHRGIRLRLAGRLCPAAGQQ